MTAGWRDLTVLATVVSLALLGCGRKGPPVAPELRVPQPVAEVSGLVRESAIELTWTNPERRVDGTRLRDLAMARVYRVEDAGTGEPRSALLDRGRIVGYTEIATVPLSSSVPSGAAQIEGSRVRLTDRRGLELGRRYTYVVLTEDATGRLSPPSARRSLTYLVSPAAPARVVAEAGEREARLRWEAPSLADGARPGVPLAYEVLRAATAEGPLVVAGRTDPGQTAFRDRDLENDRTYEYAIRALRTEAGTTAVGATSARVAVTPRDMTPPAPPTNLVAIPSEGAVRLAWTASPDADVGTYIVYRADARGDLVRIGSARPPDTVFVDRTVGRGSYRYAVTAQDSGVQPNESRRSNEVTVSVP